MSESGWVGGMNVLDILFRLQTSIAQRALGLPRYLKRVILGFADLGVLAFALWAAFTLRFGQFYVPDDLPFALLLMTAPVLGLLALAQTGLYRRVTRYANVESLNSIGVALALAILFWVLVVFMSGLKGIPRSALIMYWIFGTVGVWGARQIAVGLLRHSIDPAARGRRRSRRPVVIYGAGPAGLELAQALRGSEAYYLCGFIERSPDMWRQTVDGHKVYRPEKLRSLIENEGVKEVLVATSSSSRVERLSILNELESLPVLVRVLPQQSELAGGNVKMSDLRPIGAVDLLGREPVPPNPELLTRAVSGKSILVTGAGGSIGSEIVRQILKLAPRTVVLLEVSENALYRLEHEIQALLRDASGADGAGPVPEVVGMLGSVLDDDLVRRILREHHVQTIYHAAAYKHVPIVQRNAAIGVLNNTFGTRLLAEAAEDAGVERFVLVSTDKAVRPSSLMGASKRLAEMVLQARAHRVSQKTIFTMVRFGNVLDSSGSVVGLFRDQIQAGGPVTVTHPEMIRYFMSIPEAAGLVIQAGALATGGEVFVLDMGEPVRIDTLARSMIRLMGRTVREAAHPDGDIAIEYVGLRPGEKLREELLIGSSTKGTEHPRIQSSDEPWLPQAEIDAQLELLEVLIEKGDAAGMHRLMHLVVEGYHIGGQVVGTTPDVPSARSLH